MIRREQAFYRSRFVRWAFIVSGLLLAIVFSPWAPTNWHETPSLLWLHRFMPWPFIALLFLTYSLLLLWGTVHASVIADFLGLFLYLCDLLALLATSGGHAINPLVLVAMGLTCVLHFAAGRLALLEQEGR